MGFVVCLKGLGYVKSLSIGLPSSHVDICKAYRHIKYIKTAIREARREAEQTHQEYYLLAVELQQRSQMLMSASRGYVVVNSTVLTPNVSSTQGYYRTILTVQLLDHMISEVETRLPEANETLANGFFLLPCMMGTSPDWKIKAKSFLNYIPR